MRTPDRRAAWGTVGGVVLVQAVAAGVGFYGSTVYVEALTVAPSTFSVIAVSLATGCFMLVSGLGGILVARVMARTGPRFVLVAGALVQAAALAALGRVATDPALLLAYCVMGLGFAALTVVPAGHLVAVWFAGRQRSFAMSVAFMGLPIGGVVGVPAIAHLVESTGFRTATLWLALVLVTVVVPISVFLREPSSRTAVIVEQIPASVPLVRHSQRASDAIRTRWFVLVTAAMSLAMVSQIGMLTHLYSAISRAQDSPTGAAIVSTVTFTSLAGRVVGSWALMRFGLLRSTCALALTQALAIVGIALWQSDGLVVVAAVLLGLTVGNLQVSQPLLLADRFGPAEFPRILAVGNLFATIGMSVGPLVVGIGVNLGGGYGPSFLILAACSAGAAGLLVLAGLRGGQLDQHETPLGTSKIDKGPV